MLKDLKDRNSWLAEKRETAEMALEKLQREQETAIAQVRAAAEEEIEKLRREQASSIDTFLHSENFTNRVHDAVSDYHNLLIADYDPARALEEVSDRLLQFRYSQRNFEKGESSKAGGEEESSKTGGEGDDDKDGGPGDGPDSTT